MATIQTPLGTDALATERSASQLQANAKDLPNGPGASALLAASVGCAAMGIFALLGDAFGDIAKFFNFYNPTGPLSGVSTSAIVIWLATWFVLSRRWNDVDVNLRRVGIAAFSLLTIGFAFTFPPIMDFVQGK